MRQLSLGERMKCELVSALLHNPELIFLDEPTIGLDILSKETFRRFIKEVNSEQKTTFLVTTHDLSDIENLCSNVIIINKGIKVFDGSLKDLCTYFLGRRVLKLDFATPILREKLNEYRVIKYEPQCCQIEVDLKDRSIRDIVSELFEELPVNDIMISSIPIEEVVKEIYRR